MSWPDLAWIATHPWAYPALEVLHLVGIGLLLGSLVMVELRLWGLGRALPLPELGRFGLRITLAGFALAAATGLTMFLSHPAELLGNRAFIAKLAILAFAGLNAVAFHARGGLQRVDRVARLQTALSVGAWLAAIICGRWIAYV
jgi:hypothetical protein